MTESREENIYAAATRDMEVMVEPFYLEQDSQPENSVYLWGYKVIIFNHRSQCVQLRHRHWKIIDSIGQNQEIEGEGVVGQQPFIKPGESFEYTSGAPLSTPSGIMSGHYTMQDDHGETFIIDIPAFSLDSPYQKRTLN